MQIQLFRSLKLFAAELSEINQITVIAKKYYF